MADRLSHDDPLSGEDEASVLETPLRPAPPRGPVTGNGRHPDVEPDRSSGKDNDAPPPSDPKPAQRGLSVSGTSIRRPVGTLMIALTVVILGLFFLRRLPVDLLPAITYPRIGVRVDAPGIAPEVAVEEITRPLEEALAATEGVVQVYSQTREGQVSVDLFFEPGGDIDQALNEATAALNRARGNLPDTIEQPRLFKLDPSQLPVIEFALTSGQLQGKSLRVYGEEELARELAVVPGVAAVDVAGGAREEVQVNIDLPRLQASGVGLAQVLSALAAENQDVSAGRLEGRNREALARTVGRFRSALEIENISFPVGASQPAAAPVASASTGGGGTSAAADNGGQSAGSGGGGGGGVSSALSGPGPLAGTRRVFLRDFATVVDGGEDERVLVTLNRQPAVKVSIQKQPDANTVEVVDQVKVKVEELRRRGVLPPDAQLTTTSDESVFIRRAIKDVAVSGLTGAALAAAVILVFLGSIRQTLIIGLAIPLGTLFAILLMGVSGLSLNIFSLGGLALGIGAVDSCIVVLENIAKGAGVTPGKDARAEVGKEELIEVSQEQSKELESALVASTTTNLIAVVPFLFIGGFVALLFNELILTIIYTVVASLLTALTVVPMLTSRLLAVKRTSGLSKSKPVVWFNERFEKMTERYGEWLERAMDRRRVLLSAVFLIVGGGGAFLFTRIPTEILPRIGTGQATVIAQFPPGTPLETSNRIMQAVDEVLTRQKETQYVFTTTGGFLFGNATSENPLRGSSTVTLKDGTNVEEYVTRVNRELQRLSLVGVLLRPRPGEVRGLITSNTPVRGAEIDVILQGDDPQALQQAGGKLAAELGQRAKLAQFRPNADPPQPEVQIRRDPERASALGLSTQQIGQTIAAALEGAIPTQLQRGERLVDVRVRIDKRSLQNTRQLEQVPLFVQGNRPVRLSDVATVSEGVAPGEIQRINQRDVFVLAGSLAEGASLGEALREADEIVKSVDLPPGVTQIPSSARQSTTQLQSSLLVLGLLSVFLVYMIMAVQYDSLVDPLVILFTIPLALGGGVAGLYVTGTALGATVLIGVILLVGIVVGNGIILVELANQIREKENIERREAMAKAAPQRLRPILMTASVATLGVLPLALGIGEGTELLRPLGVVVFSGLLVSTLLTLFVVPALYLSLHGVFSRLGEKLGQRVNAERGSDKTQPGAAS